MIWIFTIFGLLPILMIPVFGIFFSLIQIITIFFLYYHLAIAFVLSFPAIQADSPSLKIIQFLWMNRQNQKFSEKEIIGKFQNEFSIHERVKDLQSDGLIRVKNSNCHHDKNQNKNLHNNLNWFGYCLALIFKKYRSWMNLENFNES